MNLKKMSALLLFLSLTICGFAEKEISTKSEIKEVTVFLQGAQVVRYADVNLTAGTSTYVFNGLSAYLDATSLQMKGIGDFTVLSVTPKTNYLNEENQSKATMKLRDTLDDLLDKREEIKNELQILLQQEQYLNANKLVKGDNSNLVATDFEQITGFFYKQMAAISRKRLDYNRQLTDLQKRIRKYQNQINAIQGKLVDRSTDVYVEVKAAKTIKAQFRLSYYVYTAGWTPSYDIRVDDISKPFTLIYKASVFQNSGEDWSNVKLTFSSANPNESGDLPELSPYYLRLGGNWQYGSSGRQNAQSTLDYLGLEQREVKGRITDANGEAISYASINVSGTNVSTFADEDGRFSIMISGDQTTLFVTALGFQNTSHVATQDYVAIQMAENQNYAVEKVVLTKSNMTSMDVSGAYRANSLQAAKTRVKDKNANYKRYYDYEDAGFSFSNEKTQEVSVLENQTTIEFTVDEPYTVVSNAKPLIIDMKKMDIPAVYEYRTVPKLEAAAYLIAQVIDWSQYQLMEGIANLYFENTFIGRSSLNVQFFSDTLDISLGKDKNVIVKRTKVKEYSSKQWLGSDVVAKRQFKIEVRNNKNTAIHIVVYDQVPLSQTKEIVVEVKEISSAKQNDKTGELVWRLQIDPAITKTMELKYNVKYPGNQQINLE